MEKNKNTQILVIAILSFAILFMSVGFATYASTLNITGTATVKASKWSVHYDTTTYAEQTGSVAASAHNLTATDFSFTVTLNKPGDKYEATATVINDGTFDAVLSSITMSTLTAAQQKYLAFEVYFDGNKFEGNQSGLSYSLPCTSGSNTKVVKVIAKYVQPESSNDLPQEDDTPISLTASLNFTQATA